MRNNRRYTTQTLIVSVLFGFVAFQIFTPEVTQAETSKRCFFKPAVCSRLAMQEKNKTKTIKTTRTVQSSEKKCFFKPAVCSRLAMQEKNKTKTIKTTRTVQSSEKKCFFKPAVCSRLGLTR